MSSPAVRRPVLAGNNTAAVYVLDQMLMQWAPEDVLVIGPPGGRKHAWQDSLAEHAEQRGLRTLEPVRVNDDDVVDAIADHGCDLLLSIYYTQVFAPALLRSVAGLALNFHPSLLPRHRGTAPLIWAIVDGDDATGLSVHELTPGVDTGPLLYQHPMPIHPDDTGYTLHQKMANLVRATAGDLLRGLAAGRPLPTARPQSGTATYHSSKDPQVNQIDWSDPRDRIRDIVRALAAPLPGAFTFHRDQQIVLDRVVPVEAAGPRRTPGMVDLGRPGEVQVWAADGALRIEGARTEQGPIDPGLLGLVDGEVLS